MSGKTVDRITKAGQEMERVAKQLRGKPHVKVGVLQKDFKFSKRTISAEDRTKKGGKKRGAEYQYSDATNGEIAIYHEYGAPKASIPERSFMRSTYDENHEKWLQLTEKLRKLTVSGKLTVKRALGLIGAMIQGDIQLKIASNIPPKLKQATIDRKKSSVALIDTGQLRGSIHYEVVDNDH